MVKFLARKFSYLLCSIIFRLKHSIFRGVVQSDFSSVNICKFGRNFAFLGTLTVNKGSIIFEDNCAVAKSASIGADNASHIVIGSSVSLGPRTIISASCARIIIGSNTSFFSDCIVSGMVTIGRDCLFANNVTVLSGTHQIYGTGTIRENDKKFQEKSTNNLLVPVVIGEDCWLGANSVILPGVTLERGVVVGANAVVTKSFPAYSIIGGVPASIIGSRLTRETVV